MATFRVIHIWSMCPTDFSRKAILLDVERNYKFNAILIPKNQVLGRYEGPVMIYEADGKFAPLRHDSQPIECEVESLNLEDWTDGTEI